MVDVGCAGVLVADMFCGPMRELPREGQLMVILDNSSGEYYTVEVFTETYYTHDTGDQVKVKVGEYVRPKGVYYEVE